MSRIFTLLLFLYITSAIGQTQIADLSAKSTNIAGFNAFYELPINAKVSIPGMQPDTLHATLLLSDDGKVNRAGFAISDSNNVQYSYGIFTLNIKHISYDSIQDHLLCDGQILMPSEFQEDSNQVYLNFSRLRLDKTGIVELGTVNMSSPIQYHGFYYGLGANHNHHLHKDSLLLDGYMVLPHNIGQLHTTLKLTGNNSIVLELDSVKGSVLHAYGYEFDAVDATYSQGIWSINSDMVVPDDFGRLRANGIKIDTSGILQKPTFDLSNSPQLNMGVYKSKPTQAWLTDNKLMMKAEFYLWDETLYLDTLTILNSGNIACAGVSITSPSATIAGYQMDSLGFDFGYFVIDSLQNQKYGFELDGRINLPNSWGNLKVNGVKVYLDGSFDGGHLTDKDSINLNGFKFHLDEGQFFPSLKYYTLNGSVQTHADTSVVRVMIDGEVVGYAPVLSGKWSMSGIHFPKLTSGHIQAINIIDTDNNGEYNPMLDAVFDISDSVLIEEKAGSLGHFKGASNRSNGSLVSIMEGSTQLGTAVVWDGHWEYFLFNDTQFPTENLQALVDKKSDGYRISGDGLSKAKQVSIEYKGQDLGKVLIDENGKFLSPVYQIHRFQPEDIQVWSFEDADSNGLIELNKDLKTDISSSIAISGESENFCRLFGKSGKPNGSIASIQVQGNEVGEALVWNGHWLLDYQTNTKPDLSQVQVQVSDGSADSLPENLSSGVKLQMFRPTQEDISQWMEFHSISTDSVGVQNASLILDGELALPKFGYMPVKGMNISAEGMRMPGKKNSYGNPHFRFDGYNYNLNSFDLDISKPQAILDGEIILPDNAGKLWAKLDIGLNNTILDKMELEQSEITIGSFIMHVEDLTLNKEDEMVLTGELDIPNMDKYLKVDQLTISALNEHKEAIINTNNLELKVNGYNMSVSKARFTVDTITGGALVDTLELWGVIDLGKLGNLNAEKLRFDNYGNVISGHLSVGDKGLKVNGFDFSTDTDSIRFINNQIHVAHISYPITGKSTKLDFRHILIDNQLNLEIDDIHLDAESYDYKGYTLTVDNMSWQNDQLIIGGILSLGGDLGNVELDGVRMHADGSLSGGSFNQQVSDLTYHGFSLKADSLNMDGQNITTLNGKVNLPDSLGVIQLTDLKLNANKVLDYGEIKFSDQTINWLNFALKVDSISFDEPYFHFHGSLNIPNIGAISVSGLKLDANGKFSGGTLNSLDSTQLVYNGHNFQLNSIEAESNAIEIDGVINLPDSIGTLKVSGLEIDSLGNFSKGHFLFQKGNVPLLYDSLDVEVNSVDFTGNVLEFNGVIELPGKVGRIGAKLSWPSNGDVILDSVFTHGANIRYSGFNVALTSCDFSNGNFVFNGSITVAEVGVFDVNQLSLSTQGDFTGGSVSFKGTEWKWDNLTATISSVSILDHQILFDADVKLPNNMGILSLKNVDIDVHGSILNAKVVLDSLNYAGYIFHLDSASVSNSDQITLAGYLKLPKNYGKIVIQNFGIKSNGDINGGVASYQGQGISLGQTIIDVQHIHVAPTSVALDGKINLPPIFGGSMNYKGLSFNNTGNFGIDSIAANDLSIQIQGFSTNLNSVSWDKQQQRINIDGSIRLGTTFGKVRVSNLQLGTDGSYYGGTFNLSGLEMNYRGVNLKPTSLSLNDSIVTANCNLTLPNNATLSVANMKIGPSGISDFGQINTNSVSFKWNNYNFELNQLEFDNNSFNFSGQLDMGEYGVLAASDIQISTSGDFYGGKFIPSGAQLKFASMNIGLDSLIFQQNEFEFSGSMGLPNNNGSIAFQEVDLTSDGKFTGGSLVYQGNGFGFKNGQYRVVPSDVILNNDNSISFDARVIEAATDSVKAIMTGAKITGNPFNIQFGTETLLSTEFYYKGYDVKVDTFTVSGTNIRYTGSITVPKLGKLDVDGMVMNVTSGQITDHGNITYSGQTWVMGNTSFTIDSVHLEEDFISIQAKMQLPNNAGQVSLHNMKLSTTGNLLGAEVDVNNINMGFNGYTISLTHAQIEGGELELDGNINLGSFGKFMVNDLEFDLTLGTFKQANIISENASFTLGSFTAVPQNISFVNNKIHIDGHLNLPAIFGNNAQVAFNGLEIETNGNFTIGSIVSNNVEVKYKGFDMAFTQLQWTDGLLISADVTLPGNSQALSLQNFKVNKDGSVSGGVLNTNGVSIAYHAYTLSLDNAEFLPGDGIKLSGAFSLASAGVSLSVTDLKFDKNGISDFGSVALKSTKPVTWHNFAVNVSQVGMSNGVVTMDGSITLNGVGTLSVMNLGFTSSGNFLPGDIKLQNQQSLNFGQYSATISRIEFSGNVISVDGSIALSGNRKVSLTGMSVDFNGNFNGGTLSYAGDPMSFNGSTVTPYGLSFANRTLTGSAQVELPNNLATVTASDVSIDAGFNVSVGKVEVSGVSIHYKGIIVNLDSAIYQGSDLSLWGNVQNQKLGNLKVTGLSMNTSGNITGGQVDYSGTQYFGALKVNITDLGFDWGQGDITVSGSLNLPHNVGLLTVDTIVLDPHSGSLKSGTLSATSPVTYGGVGITQIQATIDNNKVELSGTASLPNQIGTIGVNGLDVSLGSGDISGGTFIYHELKPITYGGAAVTISSLSFNLQEIDLSAQIQLPANLGKVGVNDAKFKNGNFSLGSVSFSGQNLAIKGVSCQITQGLITSNDVKVSVDVNLNNDVRFAVDNFDYDYKNGFSGGTFNLEKAAIKYKGFELDILQTQQQTDKAKFSARFKIPESSGYATVNDIYISLESGVDFSQITMDYGSLPNLLPQGFNLNVTRFEPINDGIIFSGNMTLLGSEVDVKGLKLSTHGIDINGLQFHTPSFKLGGYSMPNLDFTFSKEGSSWEMDISGKADVPDVGGLDFSGYIKGDGDFGGQFVLKGAMIPLGESGFALYNPGGSIYDSSGVFTIKLFGDFAPDGMNHVYVLHGELDVSSSGVISGSTVGKLFNMIDLQKSYCSINLPQGKLSYDTEFSFGVKTPPKTGIIKKVDAVTQKIPTVELMGYGGGLNVSTFTGFEISGSGNCILMDLKLGTIDLNVDEKHFSFVAGFHIPGPGGGADLVSCSGEVKINYDEGAGELAGSAAVLGHTLGAMDFSFSPSEMAATAVVDMVIARFNVDFKASKHDGGTFKLDHFHGDAYIGFESMTFADMIVDIEESQWSGSAHAWIPGFGSEIDISIRGNSNEITYFNGYEAFRIFNIQLEEAQFTYEKISNTKYISFSAHGDLPHFARAAFDVKLQRGGSHWVLTELHGIVKVFIDVNLPIFGHWHQDLGSASVDYDRNLGKLTVDIHTDLFNLGIVRITDIYGTVYFHEPSARVGVKGHYGLGKHTFHLWELHCHYHFCCHLSCHWSKCCYWTIDLGDKDFDIGVTVKGPSLPRPSKPVPVPPAPKIIVESCDADHLYAGQVCKGANYNYVNFIGKSLPGIQFYNSTFANSNFNGSDLIGARFDQSTITKLNFNSSKVESALFYGITSAQNMVFNNTNLNRTKFLNSNITGLSIKSVGISGLTFENVTLIKPSLNSLNFDGGNFKALKIVGEVALQHNKLTDVLIQNSDFSRNKFNYVTFTGTTKFDNCNFSNMWWGNSVLDNIQVSTNTSFVGTHFSQTVLKGLNLNGNQNCRNMVFYGNSSIINVDFSNADISGSSFTNMSLGKVILHNTNASNVHLTAVELAGTEMKSANFSNNIWNKVLAHKSDMSSINFSHTVFLNSDLSLSKVDSNTIFSNASFNGVNLRGVDFSGNNYMDNVIVYGSCDLHGTKFYGTNLRGATFYNIRFHKTDFKEADFTGAKFYNCEFDTVNLQAANLTNTNFYNCKFISFTDFHKSTLVGVDFRQIGTNFENTNLSGVDFTNANLTGVDLQGSTIDMANFQNTNLTNANLKGTYGAPLTMMEFDGQGNYLNLNIPSFIWEGQDEFPWKYWPTSSANFNDTRWLEIILNEPETEVTHELWFKTTNPNGGLFSVKARKGGHDRHIYLKDGNVHTRIWMRTTNELLQSSGKNYADGQWHHVAHVFGQSIGGEKLYIDGVLVDSGTITKSALNWDDHVKIGFSDDASPNHFDGLIDEVRIWRKALSEQEINDWRSKNITFGHPQFKYLIGHYNFDPDLSAYKNVQNTAFPGMISNWQARSTAENTNSLTPARFDDLKSLAFEDKLTIETWAKSNTPNWNAHGCLVSKRNGYILHPYQGQKTLAFYYFLNNNVGWRDIYQTASTNNIQEWHHYAATFGNGQAKLFVDGNKVASASYNGKLQIDNGQLLIGQDDVNGREPLKGDMHRVNIWAATLTDGQIMERARLKGSASIVTPLSSYHYKDLKLSLKKLSWDKSNYAFNGTFVNATQPVSIANNNTWAYENAPLQAWKKPDNTQRYSMLRDKTIEMNLMPGANNGKEQVMVQLFRSYETGDEIKAAYGYDIRREADRKIGFHMYRKVFQKTTGYEKYIHPLVDIEHKVIWDYELVDNEEHNIAFRIHQEQGEIELLVDGESKGTKSMFGWESIYNPIYALYFPQSFIPDSTSLQYTIGAGHIIDVVNPDSDAEFDSLFKRSHFYKGYIYDLRIWETAVSPNALKEWSTKDIDPSHPNFDQLLANYPLTDGGLEVEDHAAFSDRKVHYGDYVRLKHLETKTQLCMRKENYSYSGTAGANILAGNPKTGYENWWRVLPMVPGVGVDTTGIGKEVVKKGDHFMLQNVDTRKYFISNGNHFAYKSNTIHELTRLDSNALSMTTYSPMYWTVDSLRMFNGDSLVSTDEWQWGAQLSMKYSTVGDYLYSDAVRGSSNSQVDLFGLQRVGTVDKQSENTMWVIDEVKKSLNKSRVYGNSNNTPSYITLPNLNSAILKRTVMPDGSIKN